MAMSNNRVAISWRLVFWGLSLQLTFAIITPALIVGGFAERMKFSSMFIFSFVWMILVYAPICHMVWGGGFLGEMGLMDFAGGTVVHINAIFYFGRITEGISLPTSGHEHGE